MKMTSLMDVYRVCKAIGSEEAYENEIIMDSELIAKAKVCIDEMLRLGG
jgi:quinolinate synthase